MLKKRRRVIDRLRACSDTVRPCPCQMFRASACVAFLTASYPIALICWVSAGGNGDHMINLDGLCPLAPMARPIPFSEEGSTLSLVAA